VAVAVSGWWLGRVKGRRERGTKGTMREGNRIGSFDHGEWGVFLLVSCLVERGTVGIFEFVSASEGRVRGQSVWSSVPCLPSPLPSPSTQVCLEKRDPLRAKGRSWIGNEI